MQLVADPLRGPLDRLGEGDVVDLDLALPAGSVDAARRLALHPDDPPVPMLGGVARLFYRGKPNRQLRGVRLAAPTETGAEIVFGGRTVGTLSSVTESPAFGHVALALVRREAPPGSRVAAGAEHYRRAPDEFRVQPCQVAGASRGEHVA